MDPIFTSDESDALVGRVLPGGLRVLGRRGNTGLGSLYRAQYAAGQPVALMLLDDPPGPSPRLELLRRACELRHPNVAGLLEVGETDDGRAYAVAELQSGELLSDLLAARGAPPTEEAVDICLQAAAGLQAAHEIGIVHGDVSPSTILVAQATGDRPLVKVIHFNVDWDADAGRGRAPADEGYSSPERLAGGAPDEPGDVFSLGAVLHRLLTGGPPGAPLARASIPVHLSGVLDRALAQSPDRRYRTVASFAEALADAAKASSRPRPAPFGRPRLAGAVGVGALILAAGVWLGWSRLLAAAGARPEQEVGMRPPESVRLTPARSARPATAPPAPRRTSPKRPAAAPKQSPGATKPGDADSAVAVSPFRRAHPWAAHPDGHFYFPSSCPLALQSPELVYFVTEAEARATGRLRSTVPGCS
jgi:serine/threonine protein kinase